ncbi:MAG: type II toxin-antitoxin system VapB family antitoxin [Sphingomonadaceae bacterium]
MPTQLNIKDAETIALARDIARRRGTSITAAVRDALRTAQKQLAPEPVRPPLTREQQKVFDAVKAIARRTAPKARAAGITIDNYDDGIFDYLYGPDDAK